MHCKKGVSQVSRRRALRHAPLALALAAALGLAPLAASAATITVTSGGDAGSASSCTLRQAIVSMNTAGAATTGCVNSGAAFGSGDTIKFDTSTFPADGSGTIILGGSRLAVTATDLTLDASTNSNVTIDANHASGVLIDSAVSGSSLTLKHLTLTQGNVTAKDCNSYSAGGGICSPDADVVLQSSTVSDNSALYGGGICTYSGSVTLTNSTVSGNSAHIGGGVYANSGSVTLTNSTVNGNSAATLGNGILTSRNASITIWNSIVSGNVGGGNDIDGLTPSGGSNLISNIQNLNLGSLADNGGPTQTMLPRSDSTAIDAGDAAHCPATDQRGVTRPQDGACDIGAVELAQVRQITAFGGSGQSVPVWQTFFNPISIQVSGPDLQVAPGTRLYVTAPTGANQPSATCTDGLSNVVGLAYFYCRANGVAGSYVVQVHAAGWPAVAPAVFVLTNSADPDHLFMDGFDPPGPRSVLPFAEAGADFAISAPSSLAADVPTPVRWFTGKDGQPLVRVDALRRSGSVLWRITRYTRDGQPSRPGAWQQAPASPTLHVERNGTMVQATWR